MLVVAGSIPGIFFLKKADTNLIKMIFGFVIILIGIEMLLREFHTKKKRQSKVILIIIGILSGILYGALGILTVDVLKQAVCLGPVMLVGLFLGMKSSSLLDEKIVKKLVIILLILSGCALVINSINA